MTDKKARLDRMSSRGNGTITNGAEMQRQRMGVKSVLLTFIRLRPHYSRRMWR